MSTGYYNTHKVTRMLLSVLVMFSMVSQSLLGFAQPVLADSSATATCSGTVYAYAGDTFTWMAVNPHGIGNIAYSWSGTDGLSSTSNGVVKTYATEGTKVADFTITASGTTEAEAYCDSLNSSVVRNQKPVITLVGSNPLNLTVGDTFADPGATATDPEDGNITANITVSGTVDTAVAGTYTLTYDVADMYGLSADSVNRTVEVAVGGTVNTKPVITLVGANPQTFTVGDTYTELGATANDAEEGDITANIVIDASSVNTSIAGTYTVTYNVSDSQSLAADQITRTVEVVAPVNTAPVITLLGDNPQILVLGTPYTELDATVTDAEEGDITLTALVIASAGVDHNTLGTYYVNYDAQDSQGLAATRVVRTVQVVPATSAVCTLSVTTTSANQAVVWSTNDIDVAQSPTYAWSGDDALSGTTPSISHTYATAGTYTGTVVVDVGIGAVSCAITTAINTPPTITLVGSNPLNLTVGDTFTDPGATATDPEDGNITANITVSGTVDTAVAGTYVIIYSVTDNAGATASVSRDVVVSIGGGGGGGGNTAPTITITGANPQTITLGDAYTELGATATDAEDDDTTLTASITNTASTTVNTAIIGTYTVTYSVTDTGGLTATATRTVEVVAGVCSLPAYTGANVLNATQGQNTTLTLNFSTTTDVAAITVDNSALPAGISFATTTTGATLSGTPTVTGSFAIGMNLSNSCGTTTATTTLTVAAPATTGGGGGGGSSSGGGGGAGVAFILPAQTGLSISNEAISPILTNAAIITWNTNLSADTRVVYGPVSIADADMTAENYGYTYTTATLADVTTDHTMGVAFPASTDYYFRPVSTKDGKTVVGKELYITFETAPVVENPRVCSYLRDYLRDDFINDSDEVIKLQAYLNTFENENIFVNGIFDADTRAAVERYQAKYADSILNPWGSEEPSGYVYILTQKHINETYCRTAFPLTVGEENEIAAYKALLERLAEQGIPDGGVVSPTEPGNTLNPEINDGTIGLGNATSTNGIKDIIKDTDIKDNPNDGTVNIGNLAAIVFAFPDSVNEAAICLGWFLLLLLLVYVVGTVLVNMLSRNDIVSDRRMRIRKVAVFIVGLVYTYIPALLFNEECLIVPITLAIIVLVLVGVYLFSSRD